MSVSTNEISVYMVMLNQSGDETFIGMFTTLEKAKESMNLFKCNYGNLIINKIDLDKFYFNKVNDYQIKSFTNLGKDVHFADRYIEKIKETNNQLIILHEDNEFSQFIKEQEGESLEGESLEKEPSSDAPKKYLSSYAYFEKEVMSDIKGLNDSKLLFAEITKELGRRWKIFTPQQKLKYVKLADEDAKRYYNEMNAYRLRHGFVLKD